MENTKRFIENNIGNKFIIITDAEKKRVEKIKAIIKETYKNIFIVELIDDNSKELTRSYTYADVFSKQIKLEEIND